MPPTFAYQLDEKHEPMLSDIQQSMIRDFCSAYAQLFNDYDAAVKALEFFDRKEKGEPILEISQSNFHKKEFLESFATKHVDGIIQFMEYADNVLGPPNPFPDERIDNMFGEIDYKGDDFALAKIGKIGTHIAGKLLKDFPQVAENELSPLIQNDQRLSCGF